MGRVFPGLPKRNPGLELANAFGVKVKLTALSLTYCGAHRLSVVVNTFLFCDQTNKSCDQAQ